jgi:hypothetical protein
MWSRLLKTLHQLSAIGVMGSLACCVVLAATAPDDSLQGFLAVRNGIDAICRWLLVPSLAVVAVSGLLGIAANKAYIDAGWAWIKAVLGIVMFEGTLLTVQGNAHRAAELAAQAVATGATDSAALEPLLRSEWNGLWMMLALSFANIVLAVWRPRFSRRREPNPA